MQCSAQDLLTNHYQLTTNMTAPNKGSALGEPEGAQ